LKSKCIGSIVETNKFAVLLLTYFYDIWFIDSMAWWTVVIDINTFTKEQCYLWSKLKWVKEAHLSLVSWKDPVAGK